MEGSRGGGVRAWSAGASSADQHDGVRRARACSVLLRRAVPEPRGAGASLQVVVAKQPQEGSPPRDICAAAHPASSWSPTCPPPPPCRPHASQTLLLDASRQAAYQRCTGRP